MRRDVVAVVVACALMSACTDEPVAPARDLTPNVSAERASAQGVQCDAGNGGITLPSGFCAVVVADDVGKARHVSVAANGDVYIAIDDSAAAGGVLALRDTNGDGKADAKQYFGDVGANGIIVTKEWLYVAYPNRVVRQRMSASGDLVPAWAPQTIVGGLPYIGDHFRKNIQLDGRGSIFVNIGSASNSCQVVNRVTHSPGVDPCPELPVRAGIWRFNAFTLGQTQSSGEHFATGFRNTEALRFDSEQGVLYGVPHGRDELHDDWPEFFTQQQQADLPSEEYSRIDRGTDNGWPYCFHDWQAGKKVLAPEYGGNGQAVTERCSRKLRPMIAFPGHWAPNDLLFYRGAMFPASYKGGAFIAFHGGHDRAPLPNVGFNVVFTSRAGGVPSPNWSVFADGFTGGGQPLPQNAAHRPMGLAEGPDGSLYVTDDRGGRVYRIVYR